MEWDKVLDGVAAVVVEASPLGLEMVTALCHRGIETHLIDPDAWALSAATDPDIVAPVQESWQEKGAKLHFNTTLEAFVGDGSVRAVTTSDGEIPCDLAVVCTKKRPTPPWPAPPACGSGRRAAIIVDEHMRTSAPGVWAAGDCIEVPHSVNDDPDPGPVRQPCLRPGQGGGHQRGRRQAHVSAGLRAVGDGRRRVDDRRRLLQRDAGHRARDPARRRGGRGHLPGALLPRGQEDPGQAAGRAGHAAADRRADGRLARGSRSAPTSWPWRSGPGSPSPSWPPWRTCTPPRSGR